jgi:hypothetical protein
MRRQTIRRYVKKGKKEKKTRQRRKIRGSGYEIIQYAKKEAYSMYITLVTTKILVDIINDTAIATASRTSNRFKGSDLPVWLNGVTNIDNFIDIRNNMIHIQNDIKDRSVCRAVQLIEQKMNKTSILFQYDILCKYIKEKKINMGIVDGIIHAEREAFVIYITLITTKVLLDAIQVYNTKNTTTTKFRNTRRNLPSWLHGDGGYINNMKIKIDIDEFISNRNRMIHIEDSVKDQTVERAIQLIEQCNPLMYSCAFQYDILCRYRNNNQKQINENVVVDMKSKNSRILSSIMKSVAPR